MYILLVGEMIEPSPVKTDTGIEIPEGPFEATSAYGPFNEEQNAWHYFHNNGFESVEGYMWSEVLYLTRP